MCLDKLTRIKQLHVLHLTLHLQEGTADTEIAVAVSQS